MYKSPLTLSVLALALLATPASPPAHAASGVQRCTNGSGANIYTDKPCAALDARPAPMSGDLVARLARIHESEFDPSSGGSFPGTAMSLQPFTGSSSRRPVADGCARTSTQLAMDLRNALALGDVNRIAESYHWVDVSQSQAKHVMQRLARLGGHAVIDTHYFNASLSLGAGSWVASNATPVSAAGILQLTFGDGASARLVDFRVKRFAGCYFVRY